MLSQFATHRPLRYVTLEWSRILLIAITFLALGRYLLWRLDTFNEDALFFSYLLYAAELFGVFTVVLHIFMVWRLTLRIPPEPEKGKTVDVFIPTLNEPVSVIRRTALAASKMEYPHTTWILDDGNRNDVRILATELGCGYLARKNNLHAKAGNLNHALSMTSGDYIAIFDADHAPKHDFLTKTLGYFRDATVAFVQTPQDFYNLDSFQHRKTRHPRRIWTEQSLFFRVIQRGKDYWNAAFFCGSCAVVRRGALQEIGGFTTGTVTEDIHTSIRLHKAGYRSVYHAESLAFGIAAPHVHSFLRQRIRWGQGAMQVWRKETILFSRSLTIPQKICYIASMITYYEGWQRLLFYVSPAIVLVFGISPIVSSLAAFAQYFIPYLILMVWCMNEIGRGYNRAFTIEQYNMARFAAFCYTTTGWFHSNLRFKVSFKEMKASSLTIMYIWPQIGIFLCNAIAIPVGLWLFMHTQHIDSFALNISIVWALLNVIIAALVLLFALDRSTFQREDYRFSIPLIASFQSGGETLLAHVENISSNGMLIYLPHVTSLHTDDLIEGMLHLPDHTIPFVAKVSNTQSSKRMRSLSKIGVAFHWDNAHARNQLELFLYGSNIEWHIHHISERAPTFLEYIFKNRRWHDFDDEFADNQVRYTSLVYATSDASSQTPYPALYMMDRQKNQHSIMIYTPLPKGLSITTKLLTPKGWQELKGRIKNIDTIENDNQKMYYCQLEGAAA